MVKTLSSRLQKASQWQQLKPEGLTEPNLKNSGRPIMCPESPFINAGVKLWLMRKQFLIFNLTLKASVLQVLCLLMLLHIHTRNI